MHAFAFLFLVMVWAYEPGGWTAAFLVEDGALGPRAGIPEDCSDGCGLSSMVEFTHQRDLEPGNLDVLPQFSLSL